MRNSIKSVDELRDWFRITVRIVAPVECSLSEFKRMLQSYLFNISYNKNVFDGWLSDGQQPLDAVYSEKVNSFHTKYIIRVN